MGFDASERPDDIHSAFADPGIKALMAGGVIRVDGPARRITVTC
ncbi:hypothetical protein [Streptomyces sp. NBC_00878]|nr:hypothetical protein [Streptomyces sp. NBC_00878]MCX4909629.1 hypothetical protein [Streptomyces sp. NBC_00878]